MGPSARSAAELTTLDNNENDGGIPVSVEKSLGMRARGADIGNGYTLGF